MTTTTTTNNIMAANTNKDIEKQLLRTLKRLKGTSFRKIPPTSNRPKAKTQFQIKIPYTKEAFFISETAYEELTSLFDKIEYLDIENSTIALDQEKLAESQIEELKTKLNDLFERKAQYDKEGKYEKEAEVLQEIINIQDQIKNLESKEHNNNGHGGVKIESDCIEIDSFLSDLKAQLKSDQARLKELQDQKVKAKSDNNQKLEMDLLHAIVAKQADIKEIQLEIDKLS